MTNITSKIQRVAMENQSATAIDGADSLTFSSFWAKTDAFAGALQERDITAGDAVAIRLSHPRELLIAVFGTLRNGSVPVTMPTAYEKRDVVDVLDETGGEAYVTDDARIMSILNRAETVRVAITVDCDTRMGVSFEETLESDGINGSGSRTGIDVVRRADDDRALIAYVGRFEGDPLGAAYTHSALASAADIGRSIGDLNPAESHLGARPLSSPLELLYGATATLLAAGRYVPAASRDPEPIRSLLSTDDVARTFVTPRQYETLRDLETSGDEPVADSPATIAVVEPTTAPLEEPTGDAIRLRGRPETGLTHRRTPASVDENRVGETLPSVETRELEERPDGELAVRSPAMMSDYVGRPELTAETTVDVDGERWLRIGALGGDETGVTRVSDPFESVQAGPDI